MDQLVECVPNFSEGRDQGILHALIDGVTSTAGVALLDHSMDADHHRSVLTFCGGPDGIIEAAFRAVRIATELIDLRTHVGVHPRIGATDIVPFIPIRGTTMHDCIQLAKRLGERVGRELGIPVFLYERAAGRADHVPLEAVRRGGLDGLAFRMESDPGWIPDFGPPRLHQSAGAIAIGARPPLIAFNVNLRSTEVGQARSIARAVRYSSGGLPSVKAIGVALSSRGMVQVAMNLTDYLVTPILTAFQIVKAEAAKRGIEVAGSELVGLVPQAALGHAAAASLQLDRFDSSQVLETRIAEVMLKKEPAHTLSDFLAMVADAKPTPAGGSVAALVGALAASLGVMGARLGEQPNREQRLLELSRQLHRLVQADTDVYTELTDAYKIPKQHPDRLHAISIALQHATEVPLEIAELSCEVARFLHTLRERGKPTIQSDLTVGLTVAIAAAQAGLVTVRTNINAQRNQQFIENIRVRIAKATESLEELKSLC
ncbi:MAG: glutamate formimidoyltransferase [Nitrospira sp.]|jgi:glutamate formiminotransferase/glutamate formiminotransferase/formiminotetrahydrofolate cyclodeaminase|nr:glutamate formimidoyltransferase [Nitrospira sp.]MDI3466520.1 glutamate formiminotransferase/formiminotetrahydrofolate cyclodeaminase [Nitrospira sp.]